VCHVNIQETDELHLDLETRQLPGCQQTTIFAKFHIVTVYASICDARIRTQLYVIKSRGEFSSCATKLVKIHLAGIHVTHMRLS
jgi:hypothetical protein